MYRRLALSLMATIVLTLAAAPMAQAMGVSTTMKCSGGYRAAVSNSVPPYSGYFQRRVAFYGSDGSRVYLSYWSAPVYMDLYAASYGGYGWTTSWLYLPAAARALVLYRSYYDPNIGWHGWSAGGCGR